MKNTYLQDWAFRHPGGVVSFQPGQSEGVRFPREGPIFRIELRPLMKIEACFFTVGFEYARLRNRDLKALEKLHERGLRENVS